MSKVSLNNLTLEEKYNDIPTNSYKQDDWQA